GTSRPRFTVTLTNAAPANYPGVCENAIARAGVRTPVQGCCRARVDQQNTNRNRAHAPDQGNPMDLHVLWYLLAALMVVVGLAGIVLPALPGLPLVFAGMLLAAWT